MNKIKNKKERMNKIKTLLDLLVNVGLTVVGVLLASDRDLRNCRDEIELLLDLLEWLADHAGERTAVRGAVFRPGFHFRLRFLGGFFFLGSRLSLYKSQKVLKKKKRNRERNRKKELSKKTKAYVP